MCIRHSLALLVLVGIIALEYGAAAKLSAAARVACLTSHGKNETIDFEPFIRAHVEVIPPLPPARTHVQRNLHSCTTHLSIRAPTRPPAHPPISRSRTHARTHDPCADAATTSARAFASASGLTTVRAVSM